MNRVRDLVTGRITRHTVTDTHLTLIRHTAGLVKVLALSPATIGLWFFDKLYVKLMRLLSFQHCSGACLMGNQGTGRMEKNKTEAGRMWKIRKELAELCRAGRPQK